MYYSTLGLLVIQGKRLDAVFFVEYVLESSFSVKTKVTTTTKQINKSTTITATKAANTLRALSSISW